MDEKEKELRKRAISQNMREKNYDQAIENLEYLSKDGEPLDNDLAQAYYLRGWDRQQKGQLEPALADLRKALQLDPSRQDVAQLIEGIETSLKSSSRLGSAFPHWAAGLIALILIIIVTGAIWLIAFGDDGGERPAVALITPSDIPPLDTLTSTPVQKTPTTLTPPPVDNPTNTLTSISNTPNLTLTNTVVPIPETLTPATPTPTNTPTETPSYTLTPTDASMSTSTLTYTPTPLDITTPTTPTISVPARPQPTGKILVPVFKDGMYTTYLASASDNWTPHPLFDRTSQADFSTDGRGLIVRSWNHPDWAQRLIYLPDYTNLPGARLMTQHTEDGHPNFSPIGEIIFHRRLLDGAPQIIKLGTFFGAENNPDQNEKQLGEGENPDWLGQQIVFYAGFPKSGLYVMNPDGSNRKLILEQSDKIVPAAAPNGDQVAFSRRQDERWQIFTLSINEGAPSLTQLTNDAEANHYLPIWSPDGQYLAFVKNQDSEWAVWVMNNDGSQPEPLFTLPGSIDGIISAPDIDRNLPQGWFEEKLAWTE